MGRRTQNPKFNEQAIGSTNQRIQHPRFAVPTSKKQRTDGQNHRLRIWERLTAGCRAPGCAHPPLSCRWPSASAVAVMTLVVHTRLRLRGMRRVPHRPTSHYIQQLRGGRYDSSFVYCLDHDLRPNTMIRDRRPLELGVTYQL
jgi:hypothetical protein